MRTWLWLALIFLLASRVTESFFFDDILGLGKDDDKNNNQDENSSSSSDSSNNSDESTTEDGTDDDTDRSRFKGLDKLIGGLTKPFKNKNPGTTIVTSILGGNRDLIGNTLQTLFTTVDSCIGSKSGGWTDPDLGDFTTGKDSPYCNRKCYRSFFCCPPQKPEEINVKFIFSAIVNGKARHTDICVSGCRDTNAVLDLLKRTQNHITFFVHGLINDVTVEPIYNQTRDALLARGEDVVLVDWHEGNRLYLQSMANVRTVGALLGQLMLHMGVWDRSTCVGFSLGSHICSEAANYLKRRNKVIAKCEGIDPAGPGYDGCSPGIRLDKSDCRLVTIMHTSAFKNAGSLLFGQGFGTVLKSGHCDFWANDGMDQPKCDNGTVSKLQQRLFAGAFGKFAQDLEWAWECSHYRAVYYYLSQLRKDCNFVGTQAECGGGVACTQSPGGTRRSGEGEDRGRDGTLMTGMRGKRQVHQGAHFYANVSFPSSRVDEAREKRGLISSGVKGTLNALGLRKKKTKEKKDEEREEKRRRKEQRRKNRHHKNPEEDQDSNNDEGNDSGSAPYQNDDGYGYNRPGRPGGGRRPDWLEGNSRGDEYGGGGGRPGGGRGRPAWLEGGQGGRPGGRPGGGSNFRPDQGSGGDDAWGEEGSDVSSMGGSAGGGNGGNAPNRMSISPDDTCKPSYDVDYNFVTKGRPPFC